MSSPSTDVTDSLKAAGTVLVNQTTVTIVCAVLAVYVLYLVGRAIFSHREGGYDGTSMLAYSRGVDLFILFLFLVWMYSVYVGMTPTDKNNLLGWFLRWTHDFFNDPNSLLELTLFTLVFFVIVYLFRVPMAPEIKPVIVHIIEGKIWIVFALFIVIFFFKYILGIPIMDLIYNNQVMQYFENLPSIKWGAPSPAKQTTPAAQAPSAGPKAAAPKAAAPKAAAPKAAAPKAAAPKAGKKAAGGKKTTAGQKAKMEKNEVFNISNNMYTYQNAQEVCKAFGAKLANYDQIEKSYQDNGEWCNYGWSDGQMALMPTQKSTWQQLQNTENPNRCGRPGVNGGFIGDDKLQFGANCYGVKPKEPSDYTFDDSINQLKQLPAAAPATAAPTKEDLWKASAKLNAFNNLKHAWSQY